jgi:Concanavalin A-like lectin/glucanases superfamily
VAVRFDAAADQLSRTTALPGITLFTLCGWFRKSVDTGAWATLFYYGQNPGSLSFYLGLGTGGTTVVLSDDATSYDGTTVPALGSWVHLAMVVAGTGAGQFVAYVNGVQEITAPGKASIVGEVIIVGQDPGNEPFNGSVAAIKIWAAALTPDEMKAEMWQYLPVRTAGLVSWHPFLLQTDTDQYGASWTAGGTLTTEDGPPIVWSYRTPFPQRRAVTVLTKAPPPARRRWRTWQRVA